MNEIFWSEVWKTDLLTGDNFVRLTGTLGDRSLTLAYFKDAPDGVREHVQRYITAYLSVDETETVEETEALSEPFREV